MSATPKNKSIPSQECRSSERIREKRSRKFVMPTREKALKDIPSDDDISPKKYRDKLARLQHEHYQTSSNFTRVHNSYNKDDYSDLDYSDETDLENFIADDDEKDSTDDSSARSSDEDNKPKRKLIQRKCQEESSASEDEETVALRSLKKRRQRVDDVTTCKARRVLDSSSDDELPELKAEISFKEDAVEVLSDEDDELQKSFHGNRSNVIASDDESSGSDDMKTNQSRRPKREAQRNVLASKAYEKFREIRTQRNARRRNRVSFDSTDS